MISLPDELLAIWPMSCEGQQWVRMLWGPALASLALWLAMRVARWLAMRSASNARASGHTALATRAANASAAVPCGLLLVFVLGFPLLLPADADWSLPVLIALSWRWLALLPVLVWVLGLLRHRERQSPRWAKACALAAGLACVLLIGIANLMSIPLGCVV